MEEGGQRNAMQLSSASCSEVIRAEATNFYKQERVHTFRHAQVSEEPGQDETQCNFPVETLWSVNVRRNVQGLSIPEILCWTASLLLDEKLFHFRFMSSSILEHCTVLY